MDSWKALLSIFPKVGPRVGVSWPQSTFLSVICFLSLGLGRLRLYGGVRDGRWVMNLSSSKCRQQFSFGTVGLPWKEVGLLPSKCMGVVNTGAEEVITEVDKCLARH